MRRALALIALIALTTGAAGCAYLAVRTAPAKSPRASTSDLARNAKAEFWKAFYGGDYGALPGVTRGLVAAYLENPRDPETALLLGHAHLWRVSERARIPAEDQDPSLADALILAERYFEEAHRLAPDDARIRGWLGSVRLALGTTHADERLTRQGYFQLRSAVRAYPEFNHFTMGFILSGGSRAGATFQEGLDHMWQNLDRCAGERVSRAAPSYAPYMPRATETGPSRVCWNSPKAPHNFEGFMLNFGDMLVKAGQPETARAVYANARLSPTFETWPYRGVVEQRILKADEAAALFARAGRGDEQPEIMFNSAFACSACHAR